MNTYVWMNPDTHIPAVVRSSQYSPFCAHAPHPSICKSPCRHYGFLPVLSLLVVLSSKKQQPQGQGISSLPFSSFPLRKKSLHFMLNSENHWNVFSLSSVALLQQDMSSTIPALSDAYSVHFLLEDGHPVGTGFRFVVEDQDYPE